MLRVLCALAPLGYALAEAGDVPEANDLVEAYDLYDQQHLTGVLFGEDALKAARSEKTVLRRHIMKDKGMAGMGAVCLDGSDAGFYWAPSPGKAGADNCNANADNWEISFLGGAWCFNEPGCESRSLSYLGSSTFWTWEQISMNGLMSDDCDLNPDFCNFNRVLLMYCDGFSFAGDRAEPLKFRGFDGKERSLWFRGKRILDAALETLLGMGLRNAEQILLTGSSAGGAAAFMHADYVRDYLKTAGVPFQKFKVAPVSGFFLNHASIYGTHEHDNGMKWGFATSNAKAGMDAECLAAFEEREQWRCSFGRYAFAHVKVPIFVINSAVDWYSVGCIYLRWSTSGTKSKGGTQAGWVKNKCNVGPAWLDCVSDYRHCTAWQMGLLNAFMRDFERDLFAGSMTANASGNGAFIHSCNTHCEAQDSLAWTTIAVDGVTVQEAVSKWWHANASAPASEHTYRERCLFNTNGRHECNPTCSTAFKSAYCL